MESLGAFPDGEWDSISRLLFTEEADFTVQCSFPNDHNYGLNFETSSEIDESLFNFSDNVNSKLFNFSQESSASSNTSSVFLPTPSQQTYYFSDSNHIPITNNTSEEMEFRMLDDPMLACLKRKPETILPELQAGADGKTNAAVIPENPKKRSRVSQDVHRIRQSKKNQKCTPNGNDKEEINAAQNGQTSSCYSSGDDSNASQELNGGATSDSKAAAALNLNGKTRAIRGSATDPQSLYARKRREKINERLKILQNLVPNGTKVDISTMLEEAVHYVKFLQLQIKLLSSDDLWMYSPIAYNGMDIGLLRTISPTL